MAGATAEMADMQALTQSDFHRVAPAALLAIAVIAFVLLRDVVLVVIMVASTIVGYLATLGLTFWVFTAVLGHPGMDWKVEVFLFVVMVAVGQDYNIFLASRLAQEGRRRRPREAARAAVVAHRRHHLQLRAHHGRHAGQPDGRRYRAVEATRLRPGRRHDPGHVPGPPNAPARAGCADGQDGKDTGIEAFSIFDLRFSI